MVALTNDDRDLVASQFRIGTQALVKNKKGAGAVVKIATIEVGLAIAT